MKKTSCFSRLFSLLFLTIVLWSFASCTSAQDAQINIGKAVLRYDSDSNKLRLGRGMSTVKMAREFDVALFDFNPSQFNWSTTTGLNLNDITNHDSIWTRKLSVVKDTGDGEFSPYKARIYTLKKPSWYNGFSAFDLLWIYRSYSGGSLDAIDSVHAINETANMFTEVDIKLATSWATFYETKFPIQGQYLVFINFDYEFTDYNGLSAQTDEIDLRLLRFPSTALGSTTVKFTYSATGDNKMFRGNGSLVIPVTSIGQDETLYLQGKCTLNASADKYIRHISVNYLLVK